ncbi:polymorphic toxin-type HINT domain-containing protein [Streptomyces sp. NPDC101118]|uniref:polymorphic toxin-type HINT domain-containing protein n=1 Tax=Streptomyces sp. NPDC101118 TaxID=3366109 RepID=UPI0038040C25
MLPLALVAGLVSAAPAVAEDSVPQLTERQQALQSWRTGGPAVKSAAGAALSGSDDQVRAYLEAGQKVAGDLDLREAALQLVTDAGPGLREAAQAALAGTPEQLAAFMKDGWKAPLAQDEQVEAARITEGGGAGLREAGDKAMRGTPEDIRTFLSEGQYRRRDDDARVRVAQLEASGGPATKRAAASALKGSIEDVRDFLTYGQHIARAQDREHATITDLAKQTADAGAAADKAKKSAQEEAEKARNAARLAKEETEKAAAETQAAQNDSVKAKDAARRAAESARRAAAAAQSAIASARAANAAAQTAAIAAHNASTAALYASEAATKAWQAAASGKVNEKVAADATAAATQAEKIADSAQAMQKTLAEAITALQASLAAVNDMNLAAGSAVESGEWAQKSGLSAEEAEAAADSARRHAAEAKRASTAAQSHASAAATQAGQAAAAARSAAAHARRAAEAARHAADYANDAQKAATQAKANADEALKAAGMADAAVKEAQQVQEAARATEAEEVAARTRTQVNHARDAKAKYDAGKAEAARIQQETVELASRFKTLAAQAAQPGASAEQIAATGRKMALTALDIRGPWGRSAAEAALTGDDATVVEYVRSGWTKADEQDDRETAFQLSQASPLEDVRTAASTALAGDAAAIHAFVVTGQYQAAAADNRIEVARIAEAGGTGVKEAAKAALDSADPKALAAFLLSGQHQARIEDDRVTAAALAEGGTPEVKAAAETALASPDTDLRAFIESGRHRAQRRDQLNAAHVAQIQGIIAEAGQIAAKANQDAYDAARIAATAQGYADQAAGHAQTAADYAAKAEGFAESARKSADSAAASASAAAASAAKARSAEADAARSAQRAGSSAASAQGSALAAAAYAAGAYQAAEEAYTSARNAGMSAAEARGKYESTVQRFMHDQYLKAEQERLKAEAAKKKRTWQQWLTYGTAAVSFVVQGPLGPVMILAPEFGVHPMDVLHVTLDVVGLFPGLGEPADLANCGLYALEGTLEHFVPTGREGMWLDAGLSCASAIPVFGWGAAPVKAGRWAEKYGPKAKELFDKLADLWRRAPDCPRANSFPAGTPVLMGDGSTRPIEKIAAGDLVRATDPETGTTGPRVVEATIYTPDDREFTDIELQGNVSAAPLTSTDHHPYWVENRKRWTDAADLRVGDALRTPVGTTVRIGKVSHWKGLQPAYNLTVDDLHTYYVLAGPTPVLVHNTNPLVNCGDQVVLGVNRGEGGDALRDTLNARDEGGSWYTFNDREGWGRPRDPDDRTSRPLWMEAVEQAAVNPSVKISFSLDHLLNDKLEEFATAEDAFRFTWARGRGLATKTWEEQASSGNQTAWELGVVMRQLTPGSISDRKWSTVQFYWKGKRVEIPDPFEEFR